MSHTVGAQTTSYTWDVAAGLPVVLQDGPNTYIYGLDLISATDGGGAQTYFLYDGLGSTTDLTDGNGNNPVSYAYDVFGAIRTQTGSSANYWLFTGEQRDSDSSMYYLRARYYDPAIGRFLGQDPARAGHPYVYVGNNPLIYVDPYGLDLCGTVGGLFGKKDVSCGDVVENAWSTTRTVARNPVGAALICNPVTSVVGCTVVAIANADRIGSFLSRFATLQCLGFAFDLGGSLALAFGGPFGVPVAAGLFAGSLAIDAKEGDFAGMGLDSIAEITSPLQFAKYSPALRGVAGKTAGISAIYSGVSCAISAFD